MQDIAQGVKKPLSVWGQEWSETVNPLMAQYYPDSEPVTEWEARVIFHRYNDSSLAPDPTDAVVEIEIPVVIKAKVKVTSVVRQGLKEQYGYSEQQMWDNERVAKDILWASREIKLPYGNGHVDDFWDAVANLRGLITEVDMEQREE